MITIKNSQEIDKMRRAGKVVSDVFGYIEQFIKPEITTIELDTLIKDKILEAGATPSFLNYNGFPNSSCISLNDVVVHGIPSLLRLKEGDIVSIDIGACLDGFHGDAARTFPVGKISGRNQKLIDVTKQSFFLAIEKLKAGSRVGDIGFEVQKYVEANGFSVVRSMVGHGIGRRLHEDPNVPNFGSFGTGATLKAGNCIAIEPMVNLGEFGVKFSPDGWTCKTIDGQNSAHYENTVLILENGVEILTI